MVEFEILRIWFWPGAGLLNKSWQVAKTCTVSLPIRVCDNASRNRSLSGTQEGRLKWFILGYINCHLRVWQRVPEHCWTAKCAPETPKQILMSCPSHRHLEDKIKSSPLSAQLRALLSKRMLNFTPWPQKVVINFLIFISLRNNLFWFIPYKFPLNPFGIFNLHNFIEYWILSIHYQLYILLILNFPVSQFKYFAM